MKMLAGVTECCLEKYFGSMQKNWSDRNPITKRFWVTEGVLSAEKYKQIKEFKEVIE
ncbi:hypothetical protein QNH48_26015 [Neobacillus sp. YX16]|uniref:hypothetical protein n=1 Tax=Neobacillus sp. YX16 TaxID=3047874 RepID=UPI0024C21E98|nr:hypothetical protein [Neobacillus sp. YX16]WHZ02360.1 hypothetical protein QNH48_26015 [Neobacillus sp. YX16]